MERERGARYPSSSGPPVPCTACSCFSATSPASAASQSWPAVGVFSYWLGDADCLHARSLGWWINTAIAGVVTAAFVGYVVARLGRIRLTGRLFAMLAGAGAIGGAVIGWSSAADGGEIPGLFTSSEHGRRRTRTLGRGSVRGRAWPVAGADLRRAVSRAAGCPSTVSEWALARRLFALCGERLIRVARRARDSNSGGLACSRRVRLRGRCSPRSRCSVQVGNARRTDGLGEPGAIGSAVPSTDALSEWKL